VEEPRVLALEQIETILSGCGSQCDAGVENEHLSAIANLANEANSVGHGFPRSRPYPTRRQLKHLSVVGRVGEIRFINKLLRADLPAAETTGASPTPSVKAH
jgi:hypothetical protein